MGLKPYLMNYYLEEENRILACCCKHYVLDRQGTADVVFIYLFT